MPRIKTPEGQKIANRLLNAAPVKWEKMWEKMTAEQRLNAQAHLLAMAQKAVRVSEYIHVRSTGASHQRAVSAQNKRVCKVRKVLGYSIPNDYLYF